MSNDMNHHIKIYKKVFISLLLLTGVTVGVSYYDFGGIMWLAVGVGLFIAFIKGYLVAANFMHLNSEKSTIYMSLAMTFMFFIVLFFMPLLWHNDSLKAPDSIPKANGNVLKEIDNHDDHGHH